MSLTDTQAAALRVELQRPEYAGLTADQAFALLHNPQSTSSTSTVPRTLSLASILSGISQESAAKLAVNPNVRDLRDKILAQDRVGVGLWVALFAQAGVITASEANMVNAALVATDEVTTTITGLPRISVAFHGVAGMPNKIDRADFDAVLGSM